MTTKRKKHTQKLPPYVFLKHGDWYVKLQLPTTRRDAKGRIVDVTITRKCSPETSERAALIVAAIKGQIVEVRKEAARQNRGRVHGAVSSLQEIDDQPSDASSNTDLQPQCYRRNWTVTVASVVPASVRM
jgi:hypothetical protein